MGRTPKITVKLNEFKNFCKETEPLNPFVLYSPVTGRIALSFCNHWRRREIIILGGKGIFFIKQGYLGSSYKVIGKLID